jgi:membrane-associated phospholipid phosphatase
VGLLALVLPRRWAMVAFVLAALNAVARVYLGAHDPLDVVGGAAGRPGDRRRAGPDPGCRP